MRKGRRSRPSRVDEMSSAVQFGIVLKFSAIPDSIQFLLAHALGNVYACVQQAMVGNLLSHNR